VLKTVFTEFHQKRIIYHRNTHDMMWNGGHLPVSRDPVVNGRHQSYSSVNTRSISVAIIIQTRTSAVTNWSRDRGWSQACSLSLLHKLCTSSLQVSVLCAGIRPESATEVGLYVFKVATVALAMIAFISLAINILLSIYILRLRRTPLTG